MELTNHGMVKSGCHNVMRTEDGRWMVSRSGTLIGYVDSLAEVDGLIEGQREAVRARLARVTAEANARQSEADTDLSMRRGEGMGIDPNH